MIAIAESGSTKCEWVLLSEDHKMLKRIHTIGFNPDFHTSQAVVEELSKKKDDFIDPTLISNVYFYGAGCSSKRLQKVIQDGLSGFFTEAKISVDHDLSAAAYSLYEDEPIIACILGTGSNSCYFDGQRTHERIPALGFLLGDEGGGGYYGKQLFRAYFYNLLPDCVAEDFSNTYDLSWEDVRKRLYKSNDSNVYAASFMPFLAKHSQNEYIRNMLKSGFQQFIDVHIKCFEKAQNVKICFVGSVAYYFQDIIKELLEDNALQFGRIIKSPIDDLVNYHRQTDLSLNSL